MITRSLRDRLTDWRDWLDNLGFFAISSGVNVGSDLLSNSSVHGEPLFVLRTTANTLK